MISFILAIIAGFAVLGLDQLTKFYISANLELHVSHDFIPGLIDITYIRNGGGAWGMLNGYTWMLLSITIIIMLICISLLIKMGFENKLMFWAICLVLGGGIGNMIDRIFRGGQVIDFLHFSFWPQFPVFNVADIGIVLGAGLLVLYFIVTTVNESKTKKQKTVAPEEEASQDAED